MSGNDPPVTWERRPAPPVTAEHQPLTRPTRPGRLQRNSAQIEYVGRYYDDAVLTFRHWHGAAVAMLGRLPVWARRWDAAAGCWWVHPGFVERVVEDLQRFGIVVEAVDRSTK